MSIWHASNPATNAEASILRCDKFVYGSRVLGTKAQFCSEQFTLDRIDDVLLRSAAAEVGWQSHPGGGVPSKPAFDYCPLHRVA